MCYLLFNQTIRRGDSTVYRKAPECSLRGRGLFAWLSSLPVTLEPDSASLTSVAQSERLKYWET